MKGWIGISETKQEKLGVSLGNSEMCWMTITSEVFDFALLGFVRFVDAILERYGSGEKECEKEKDRDGEPRSTGLLIEDSN